MPPTIKPRTKPVNKESAKLSIGAAIFILKRIAGTPIPIPVRIEPPKSKIPSKEPSKILANKKLAPNAAAAL